MRPNDSPSVPVVPPGSVFLGSDPPQNVVWLRGEHDLTTRLHLSAVIAEAARRDAADVVVDLSGVTFMDASTIGALLEARNRLGARSRSLTLRAPSRRARRVLDLCGLEELIDQYQSPAPRLVAQALGSWVDVPASDGDPFSAQLQVAPQPPALEPAPVAAQRSVEPERSVEQRRAPS